MSDNDLCTELATLASDKSIATWDDNKRRSFIALFKERSAFGAAVLHLTAYHVWYKASAKKYLSNKHNRLIKQDHPCKCSAGVRQNEAAAIADKRADAILESLPPLKDALRVIDPDTSKKLDRLAKMKEEANTLFTKVTELSEPIDMADDGYQKMTVREFRVMVNERLAERRAVGQKLENLAEDGTALEVEVNKRLYSGIPGLTDAIVNLYDQAAALNEVTRRLEERVLFGDSEAALEMLRRFEKDEVEVSEEIRAEFRKALETLKVSKKQLKGKK
jgi:hypothetical protein